MTIYTREQFEEILKDNVVNLRFHARGGQGGVTASNLCVEAFYGYGICQPRLFPTSFREESEAELNVWVRRLAK